MNSFSDRAIQGADEASGGPRVVLFSKHVNRTPNRAATRHTNRFWVLDCHVRDAGEYSLDGRAWERRARNTMHLYAPETTYWERCGPKDVPFDEIYFIFKTDDPGPLLERVEDGAGFARFSDASEILSDGFDFFFRNFAPSSTPWGSQGLLLLVLDLLLSARKDSGFHYAINPLPAEHAETLSSRVDAYLAEHFHEGVTLGGVANEVGVSRSTLSHQYRRETGVTPATRLTEFRLNAAQSMILKGERLKIVASRTGFCDEYHLSKAFKKRFGHSPRKFLREIHFEG